MMNLHEWTPFSAFIYIHMGPFSICVVWCLETGSHSVAQAGFEVPASASGALGFHFAYIFLLLASQNLQKVVHSVGGWPFCPLVTGPAVFLLCVEMSHLPRFSLAGILCPGFLGRVCEDLLRNGWLRVPISSPLGCHYIPVEGISDFTGPGGSIYHIHLISCSRRLQFLLSI